MKRITWFFIIIFLFLNPFVAYAQDIVITENGAGSENSVLEQTTSEVVVVQSNNSDIQNNILVNANTGNNSVTQSSGDSKIDSGDAQINTIVSNSANTNVLTDQNCCQDSQPNTEIIGNGTDTTNSIDLQNTNTNTFVSQNNAVIKTKISGIVNTGNNLVADNLGSATILTGDAKVVTSVKNGPVNTTTYSVSSSSSIENPNTKISNNASNSQNTISVTKSTNNQLFLDNNSVILNEVIIDANTGGNLISKNIGDIKIVTGNILIDLIIQNDPINTNIVEFTCCTEIIDEPVDPIDPNDPTNPADPITNSGNSSTGSSNNSNNSANGSGIGGGGILGLSNTSSGEKYDIKFFIGILSMVLGLGIIIDSLGKTKNVKANHKNEKKFSI